ncbi:MAG TPA: diaminopimelate decarboxylase [Gemmatimonadales bacterium]
MDPAGRAAVGASISRQALLFDDAGLSRNAAGVLQLDGVSVEEIARATGTPAYVYDAGSIRRRYRALAAALNPLPHQIDYAVKANSSLAVLRVLRDLGAGCDIVSAGELFLARTAGFDPERIVFSGVGKTRHELTEAIEAGIGQINLESMEELDLVSELARTHRGGRPIRVGIRVNPDVTVDTHPYITTGTAAAKFGIPADQVIEAARRIAAGTGLVLTGIAMHVGSQLLETGPYVAGATRLAGLAMGIREAGITSLSSIGIGGGLGIRYKDEAPLEPEALARAIAPIVAPLRLTLRLEPGRYLVGSAGLLLTTVLFRKQAGGKHFVVVDAGMTDLVRPSRYHAHHEVVVAVDRGRPVRAVDLVGPICESGDFLALDRDLPLVEQGDVLAILGAGAYGFVMASTYNARPRPPEILVDGGKWAVVRPRETREDLIRGEPAAS